MFTRLMEMWLNFVAFPMVLTEKSTNRGLRILGAFAMFPWFLLLALIGPLVMGSIIIILTGLIVEEA